MSSGFILLKCKLFRLSFLAILNLYSYGRSYFCLVGFINGNRRHEIFGDWTFHQNSEFWLLSILNTNLLSFYMTWYIHFQITSISMKKKEKKKKEELCVKCLARFNFLPVSAEFLQHNENIWNTSKGKETTQSHHHSMNQRDFVMWQYDHHHMRELLSTNIK